MSWIVTGAQPAERQLGYQIQCGADPDFGQLLGEVTENLDRQLHCLAPGGPFTSREIRFYRVRIKLSGGWSAWSKALKHEVGLLESKDFSAVAISNLAPTKGPVGLFRKSFRVDKPVSKARLYLTGEGLVAGYLNGEPTSQEYLVPGWTAYQDRLNVVTHDVTKAIQRGENVLAFELADGWHRGRFGFMNQINNYGTLGSILAQLEIVHDDGSTKTIATDSSFTTSDGEIRSTCIYDGSVIDFNFKKEGWLLPGFDEAGWQSASVVDFDKSKLKARYAEPVMEVERFPMRIENRGNSVLLQAEQNVAGWVSLLIDGKKGQRVVVTHAEVLDNSGQLHVRALRTAKARDEYVLASDGVHSLSPKFTYHGFQFAEVVTDASVLAAEAVAISSNIPVRATFQSSHAGLNRLHQNIFWSLRDNYVALPTDCPQRDERMGWTGDVQAFSMAASTLVQQLSFMRSWLEDMRLDQEVNGDVPVVVPNLMRYQPSPLPGVKIEGMAGWADAVAVVPWSLYKSYGSEQVLEEQIPAILRWLEFCESRIGSDGLLPESFQLGDWLDPDAPISNPAAAKVAGRFVSNAYLAHTYKLTSKILQVLNRHQFASELKQRSEALGYKIWDQLAGAARTSATGCSMLIEFGIAPEEQVASVAADLARIISAADGRIETGFLGTPLFLLALASNGYTDVAYQALLRTESRSWLYQVERGATTIWERWDAIGPNGEINDGELEVLSDEHRAAQDDHSMTSFNHYAYGAVADWMYQYVVGIGIDADQPGYRKFFIQPQPHPELDFAAGEIQSPFGTISCSWKRKPSGIQIELDVPFGAQAVLNLPLSQGDVLNLEGKTISNGTELGHGQHLLDWRYSV